jgi:hypothetical protein
MTKDETPEYRKHKLVARLYQGSFKGRVYDPTGKQLTEIKGSSLDEVMSSLRDFVDAAFISRAKGRTSPPEAMEYVRAFQNIFEDLPDSYRGMLKAHYHATNRTMTATQLAEAGKYINWSSANLHYGLLGKRLYDELPIQLPVQADGTLIYTFTLATEGNLKQDESEWQWKLRPEVAEAIEHLGLQE